METHTHTRNLDDKLKAKFNLKWFLFYSCLWIRHLLCFKVGRKKILFIL